MLPKPNAVETYLHDVDHMEDHELEAKYYTSGIAAPRYPMPAIPTRVVHTISGIPRGTNQYLNLYAANKCVGAWDKDVGPIHGNYI